jgi:hypothetical protein
MTARGITANKRKRMVALTAISCFMLLGMTLVLPSSAEAWDDCPKGLVNDPYPGACRRYVDTNGDGICDLSQSESTTTTKATVTTTTAVVTTTAASDPPTGDCPLGPCSACGACTTTSVTGTDGSVDSTGLPGTSSGAVLAATADSTTTTTTLLSGDSGGASLVTHYLVSPIAIGFFLIYGTSFVLYRTKRIRISVHRKIWNLLLLTTFLVTGVFGLILTIDLDYTLPFTIPVDLLFWHVEAGIVMTLISLFHAGWHFNYYRNVLRSARRRAPQTK